MISGYLDGKRIECGDIEAVRCDRCGEGLAEWQEANTRWSKEWGWVQTVLSEVSAGYAVCWAMAESTVSVGPYFWTTHDVRDCRRYEGLTDGEMKRFRESIRYSTDTHSCMKCGISQAYCATGEDSGAKCQWSFVLTPIVRSAVGLVQGIELIREVGFTGPLDGDFTAYARWLGKRHGLRVWGQLFSNAMVVCIRMILRFSG